MPTLLTIVQGSGYLSRPADMTDDVVVFQVMVNTRIQGDAEKDLREDSHC
jgi:uncharacterized protein YihD (DUF1040 family)